MNPTSLSLTITSINVLAVVIWLIRLSKRVELLEKLCEQLKK